MTLPRVLETITVDSVERLATPDSATISLDSPALAIFTDFEQHWPLAIDASASLQQAEEHMRVAHVKLKLVVDTGGGFLGMVGYRDLSGDRHAKLISLGVAEREITVRDVMTPRAELRAITYEQLAGARIGDVVETLNSAHCQHFLVTDPAARLIRGVLSASDIARRLHILIDITQSPTFADICHAMAARAELRRHAI